MTLFHPPESSAATHPGLKRENNEDCFLSAPESGLWLVADGMGGHEAGEVASAIVRDTFANLVQQQTPFSLADAVQNSHRAILTAAENGTGALGMGSTIVAVLSQKKTYQVAWVGDSRAYLWNPAPEGGQLSRLTTDHSYVQMLFNSGAISAEEVEKHPDKNIITQCLGMQELAQVKVDVAQGQWQKGQWILICSDGLTDELDDSAIAQILETSTDSSNAVDKLLRKALKNGGNDNITLQVIESPLSNQEYVIANFWIEILKWIPQVTHNRRADAIIYVTAIVSLLTLLFVTLK
jgi:serine/threonine protein phosphatase PrpC